MAARKYVEVIAAEIKYGRPYLHARTRKVDFDLNNGAILEAHDEFGPEWVWYPTWEQYDQFWARVRWIEGII